MTRTTVKDVDNRLTQTITVTKGSFALQAQQIDELYKRIETLEAALTKQPQTAPAVAKTVLKRVEDTAGYTIGTHFCHRCGGTGRFITRIENGKPVGPAGHSCFRCDGKGHHTQADRKRNYGHAMNYVPPGIAYS